MITVVTRIMNMMIAAIMMIMNTTMPALWSSGSVMAVPIVVVVPTVMATVAIPVAVPITVAGIAVAIPVAVTPTTASRIYHATPASVAAPGTAAGRVYCPTSRRG